MDIRDGFVGSIGNTPLIRLRRASEETGCEILGKAEFMNPGGSVKDRAALNMIIEAEKRGEISPGDTLIEATSGNTGIALAMVSAIRGYKMVLVMQENLSQERRDAMTAYGAKLILVSEEQGMEGARIRKCTICLAYYSWWARQCVCRLKSHDFSYRAPRLARSTWRSRRFSRNSARFSSPVAR